MLIQESFYLPIFITVVHVIRSAPKGVQKNFNPRGLQLVSISLKGEMIDKLTLTYNQTRQAVITRELIEIISGAAALN